MTSQLAQQLVLHYRFYSASEMRLHVLLSTDLEMHASKVIISVFIKERTNYLVLEFSHNKILLYKILTSFLSPSLFLSLT